MIELEIAIDAHEVERALDFVDGWPYPDYMAEMGGVLLAKNLERFRRETSPDGVTWKDWAPSYRAPKHPGHTLLNLSGELRRSLGVYNVGRSRVEVGTPVAYAPHVQKERPFLGIGARDLGALADHSVTYFERRV